MKFVVPFLLLGLTRICSAASNDFALAEKYFRPPLFSAADLSPNGAHVVYRIVKADDHRALAILEVSTGQVTLASRHPDDNISSASWLDSDHLLVNGYFNGRQSLNMVDRVSLQAKPLVGYTTDVLSVPRRARNRPWIQFNDGRPTILQIDGFGELSNSRVGRDRNLVRAIEAPTGNITQWLKDPDGEVRGCLYRNDNGIVEKVYWRPDLEKSDWQPITRDWSTTRPFVFNRKGDLLVVAEEAGKARGLHYLNPGTGELGPCLFRDERYNLQGVQIMVSTRGSGLGGVLYERERPTTVWFDPAFKALQEFVDRQLPECSNILWDWDDSQTTFLVYSSGPQKPGTLYSLDLKARKLNMLGTAYPDLDPKALAPTQKLTFRSAEGYEFAAYLTVPAQASRENPAPMVVLCGTWPWNRPHAIYESTCQWLAAQGIATLRSEQRGCDDFPGPEGLASAANVTGAVADRLAAVGAALATGVVDRQRLGIYGGQYGVYTALAMIRQQPGTFKCAALVDGIFSGEVCLERLERASLEMTKAIQAQLKAPEMSTAFRRAASFEDVKNLRTAFLIEYDAPIDQVARSNSVTARVAQTSQIAARALKGAGATVDLRPITDEKLTKTGDRRIMTNAAAGEFFRTKL
jgi:dipeptidyl aminopeptidase/acylaminoacyl peptidase